MNKALVIEVHRDAYDVGEIAGRTLTVGQLIEVLDKYDSSLPVVIAHDNGYTYGKVTESCMTEEGYDPEEEDHSFDYILEDE